MLYPFSLTLDLYIQAESFEEARYKDFDEKLEEWKSGEINFLNTPFYIPGEKPNAWIRIKGNNSKTQIRGKTSPGYIYE